MTHAPPYSKLAPLYDRLVGDAGFSHLRRAFRHACRKHDIRFSSLADVGCGTGRFLADVGSSWPQTRLIGVDRSASMLLLARRRLGRRAVLLCQDLRKLSLPGKVDVVTCNFNTLNCILDTRDLLHVFSKFAENLASFGHLVFDILTTSPSIRIPGDIRQRIRLDGVTANWRIVTRPDQGGSVVFMKTCTVGPDDRRDCWQETHRQRWWPLSLVARLLAQLRFEWLGTYRPYDPSPPAASDRWVQVVAKRSY